VPLHTIYAMHLLAMDLWLLLLCLAVRLFLDILRLSYGNVVSVNIQVAN